MEKYSEYNGKADDQSPYGTEEEQGIGREFREGRYSGTGSRCKERWESK